MTPCEVSPSSGYAMILFYFFDFGLVVFFIFIFCVHKTEMGEDKKIALIPKLCHR